MSGKHKFQGKSISLVKICFKKKKKVATIYEGVGE